MKLQFGKLLALTLIASAGCAPNPNNYAITESICLPVFRIPSASASSTAVMNLPTPDAARIYSANVGDHLINRGFYREQLSVDILEDTALQFAAPANVSAGNVNAYVPQWISESLTGDELASITHGSKCIGHPITSEKAAYYAYIAEKLAGAIQTYGVSRQTIITATISKGATPAKMVLGNHGLLLENLNISKESMGSLDNYISESSIGKSDDMIVTGLYLPYDSSIPQLAQFKTWGSHLWYPLLGRVEVSEPKEKLVADDPPDGFFNQTLIYNGRAGEQVKFLYREFSGNTNRAPFAQEVTYDLNEGEVIGFKAARFRIMKATNTEIQYQVLEPFAPDAR